MNRLEIVKTFALVVIAICAVKIMFDVVEIRESETFQDSLLGQIADSANSQSPRGLD